MIVLPVIILIVAGGSWWWGEQRRADLHEALHTAVFTLTQGQLEGSARSPEGMRLRWANNAMQVVFASAVPTAVAEGTWAVIIDDPTVDEAGLVLVRIKGESGWVDLEIRPMDGAATGVITSIRASAPTEHVNH